MGNKELFFILFFVVFAVTALLLVDDFNKRLGIQEEKVNKLVENEEKPIFSLGVKRKIGFVAD
jgi:hypothetical protein